VPLGQQDFAEFPEPLRGSPEFRTCFLPWFAQHSITCFAVVH